MNIIVPIMEENEVRAEILNRIEMPKPGWLDITKGINLEFDSELLASAAMAVLQDFSERGVKNVEKLVTCESSGNVIVTLGVPAAKKLKIAVPEISGLTFRKSAEDEGPMFDLSRQIKSASHGNRIYYISTRADFLRGKRVLMLDDILRDGGTAEAIKEMTEEVGGTFLGLGVFLRKMWLKDKQTENLWDTLIIYLIDVPSPDPKEFEELKKEV